MYVNKYISLESEKYFEENKIGNYYSSGRRVRESFFWEGDIWDEINNYGRYIVYLIIFYCRNSFLKGKF